MDDAQLIQNSALWAAYGDALGFMTEFATASVVRSKYGKTLVTELQPWTRGVGGRFGVQVLLPKGCYSDDTQLRLATSRAVMTNGTFDLEAFARVELPVWTAYALGGGRSTKAASVHLATSGVSWSTNFYDTKGAAYTSAGGNGAAMRIQPLVWSARDWADPQTYVSSVVRNAVCTHGHPKALLGAVFHAVTLATALRTGRVPEPKDLETLASQAGLETFKAIDSDKLLSSIWVGVWERTAARSFERALRDANDDLRRDLGRAGAVPISSSFTATYGALANALDAFSDGNRGSAISTAVLSAYLAWLTRDEPNQTAIVSTNALGTDTDTVASLAGALVGAIAPQGPPEEPLDAAYICAEAARLARTRGRQASVAAPFEYPDLLQWEPPRSQLDVVQTDSQGNYVVAGLGRVKTLGESFVQPPAQGGAVWQWLELEFGQHLLIKRRPNPRPMKTVEPSVAAGRRAPAKSPSLFESERQAPTASTPPRKFYGGGDLPLLSVEEAIRRAIESNYDPIVIGKSLLSLTERPRGVEMAIAFAAVVATRGQHSSQRPNVSPRPPAPRQEQQSPQRIVEDFSLTTRVVDDRIYVAVKNDGQAETFKGQIIRLSNVDKLPAPLPWTIRWKDQSTDTIQILHGQEGSLELARAHPATLADPKTGDFELGIFDFFTPRDVIQTKLRVGDMDQSTKAVEAVVRITTGNPKRAKSVTVLLSTSLAPPELSVSVQD